MKKNKILEIFPDGSLNIIHKTTCQKTSTIFYIEDYKTLQTNVLKSNSKSKFFKNSTKNYN